MTFKQVVCSQAEHGCLAKAQAAHLSHDQGFCLAVMVTFA